MLTLEQRHQRMEDIESRHPGERLEGSGVRKVQLSGGSKIGERRRCIPAILGALEAVERAEPLAGRACANVVECHGGSLAAVHRLDDLTERARVTYDGRPSVDPYGAESDSAGEGSIGRTHSRSSRAKLSISTACEGTIAWLNRAASASRPWLESRRQLHSPGTLHALHQASGARVALQTRVAK